MRSKSSLSFATFMVLCPTSFFLGILYSLFPYDYPLLWSREPITSLHLDKIETHLKLLHNSPNLVVRMLHIVTVIGLIGLIIKLYKPAESNLLFDGGSLVLYMIAIIVYLTNIVKGLRIVSDGTYGLTELKDMTLDQLDDVDAYGNNAETGYSVLGREDNLKVLAASNVITALVLVGVIVLQAGQWYAERVDAKEKEKFEAAEAAKKKVSGSEKKGSSSAGSDKEPRSPVLESVPEGDGAKVSRKGSARERKNK